MWRVGDYVIERPVGVALNDARTFCIEAYKKHGYLQEDSDNFPVNFFSIRQGVQMHGTIGVYLPEDLDGMSFPTEYVYGFRLEDVGIKPEWVGEVSRLSGNGRIFVPIIAWMADHMYTHMGMRYAMFGVKPFIQESLAKMGIPTVVHGQFQKPILERVPEEFIPYFAKDPAPIVVTVDLAEAQEAVRAHLMRMAA